MKIWIHRGKFQIIEIKLIMIIICYSSVRILSKIYCIIQWSTKKQKKNAAIIITFGCILKFSILFLAYSCYFPSALFTWCAHTHGIHNVQPLKPSINNTLLVLAFIWNLATFFISLSFTMFAVLVVSRICGVWVFCFP